MDLALAVARTGLEAQHQNLEIISNNLANASTTGYKRSHAEFADLPYQIIKQPGSPTTQQTNSPAGLVLGTGTKLVGNTKVFRDGSPIITGNTRDVEIMGRGFFQVALPNGAGFAYTRAGNFKLNETGQLTDYNGNVVQPAVTIPPDAQTMTISEDGTINVTLPGSTTTQQVGQLQLADFINPDGLQPIGGNLFIETTGSGVATLGNPQNNGLGTTVQGQLEGSNVSVVEEMVNLIEAQRAFEVTSKAVSTVDSMMQYLTQRT